MLYMAACKPGGLVKQSSGASALQVQHTHSIAVNCPTLPEAMISIKFRLATGILVRFRYHSQMCLGKLFRFPELSIASPEFPVNSQILGSS